jgi:universal stress protein A
MLATMESPTVLCAVDFSESSRVALHAAAELAHKMHARLAIVHVAELPLWTNEPYFHLPGDQRQEFLARTETQLAQWVQEARSRGISDVTGKLPLGVPWEQIVAFARADPTIEWIVIGSHGRTGITRALLGSVAERVVRHAPCSVVVVRTREER